MLARAQEHRVLDLPLRVVDAADLIALKLQSSSNDPCRRRRDLADIERLLARAEVDLERVREYFRLLIARRSSTLPKRISGDPTDPTQLDDARMGSPGCPRRGDASFARANAPSPAGSTTIATGAADLSAAPDWIDSLRSVFGDSAVDRPPYGASNERGNQLTAGRPAIGEARSPRR
jgi:hypothetical protein